jgi:hypothetical protein
MLFPHAMEMTLLNMGFVNEIHRQNVHQSPVYHYMDFCNVLLDIKIYFF